MGLEVSESTGRDCVREKEGRLESGGWVEGTKRWKRTGFEERGSGATLVNGEVPEKISPERGLLRLGFWKGSFRPHPQKKDVASRALEVEFDEPSWTNEGRVLRDQTTGKEDAT